MGNLGHLVHHLEQVSKLIGGGIGADFDRKAMPVDCQVTMSNPPAAVTRTPFNSIPSPGRPVTFGRHRPQPHQQVAADHDHAAEQDTERLGIGRVAGRQ